MTSVASHQSCIPAYWENTSDGMQHIIIWIHSQFCMSLLQFVFLVLKIRSWWFVMFPHNCEISIRIKYSKKNVKTRKNLFLKIFLSDLKMLSIRNKIETICLPTVHGEDSTPLAFFEHVELAQFHGCCSAFVFVWASDGQWDCLVDPPDGDTSLDEVCSSTACWHSAGRRTQFLGRLLYTISKTL